MDKSLWGAIAILITTASCSSNTAPPAYFEHRENFRSVANIEAILSKEEVQLNSCFESVKNDCYRRYPFFEDSPNLSAEDKQLYLKSKINFQSCVLDEAVVCAYQSYNQEYVERLNRFKREFLIEDDRRHLAWTQFREINLQNLMDLTYDIDRLQRSLNSIPTEFKSVEIDNGDLVGIGNSFRGIALSDSDKLSLYCHSSATLSREQSEGFKLSYRKEGCGQDFSLSGQKLMLNFESGQRLIVGFNFGQFAEHLQKLNGQQEINLELIKSQIIQVADSEINLELAIANQIFNASPKLQQEAIQAMKKGKLNWNKNATYPSALSAFITALKDGLDSCLLWSLPTEFASAPIEGKVYIVKFGQFGTVETQDKLTNVKVIEFLNPFLLRPDKLQALGDLEKQSLQFKAKIKEQCSSKKVIVFDQDFIQNQIL